MPGIRNTYLVFTTIAGGILILLSAMTSAKVMSTEQAQRDLTRVLSEVFHRAISRERLGEVTRPEFASAKIDLSVPALSEGWTPSCDIEIQVVPSNPRRNLQALILVPSDRISSKGAEFTAFAFYVGELAFTSEIFANPPTWLTEASGGYASLESDIDRLLSHSDVTVQSTTCDDFSFSVIQGRSR